MPSTVVPQALRDALDATYDVQRELGRGGMATVYLAHDRRHDRLVALKVLESAASASLGVERFEREIRVLARLRHPFVLPLHDSGDAGGALYFVTPYIDGESLRARLDREPRLSLTDATGIIRQISDALDYAHGEGVLHRDVKPENILLSRHGHALLADFGIARGTMPTPGGRTMLTEIGLTVGTAEYMSPEQALGEPGLDNRSDLYSLGCVLFEMLAGHPPFAGATPLAVVAQHIGVAAPNVALDRSDLPVAVVNAVARALDKTPAARFATGAAFVRALLPTNADVGPTRPEVASTPRLSVAVLPVVNQSADAETEYFSDGMTEELINALAKVEGLRVVSRTSAFTFKGASASIRDIGDRLGVGFVLEASVRRSDAQLRMTARLIDIANDSTIWSERYERQLQDVFAVQDDITARIVDTITRTLQLGHLRGAAPVHQARSLEAYDLYLLGRHHWYKRTDAEMRRALELFQLAVEADPSYAPAYSGIADASALLASWQFASTGAMYPQAAAAARRAIELDPTSADAHASIGFVNLNWEWDWDEAGRELRTAITLNPNHETAHRWLSAFLAGIGRDEEAMPIARRAAELDPISVLPLMNLGVVHFLAGRHADAAAQFRRVVEREPNFVRGYVFLASAQSLMGRHDEGIATARIGVARSNGHPMFSLVLASCVALAGRPDEARAMFIPVFAGEVQPIYRAMAHAVLGDEEAAIDSLERGYAERSDWMYSIRTQPWFLAFHGHPRFVQLVERMRLV